MKDDPLLNSVYALPLISFLIALPYFLLCLAGSLWFGLPYYFGLFWFVVVCPVVVLIWIGKAIYTKIKTGRFDYSFFKSLLLLMPPFILYAFTLIRYGCAISV